MACGAGDESEVRDGEPSGEIKLFMTSFWVYKVPFGPASSPGSAEDLGCAVGDITESLWVACRSLLWEGGVPSWLEPTVSVEFVLNCTCWFPRPVWPELRAGLLCKVPAAWLACEACARSRTCLWAKCSLTLLSWSFTWLLSALTSTAGFVALLCILSSSFQENYQPFPPCGGAEAVCIAFRSHCRISARHGARPFKCVFPHS